MKAKLGDVLEVVPAAPAPQPSPQVRKKQGRRAGDVEADILRALDNAHSQGSLWVIHGFGTGALKQRVREVFSDDPLVKRLEDAPQNEGGAGCTVAVMKR